VNVLVPDCLGRKLASLVLVYNRAHDLTKLIIIDIILLEICEVQPHIFVRFNCSKRSNMGLFDSFIGQAATLVVLLAVSSLLISKKEPLLKAIGAIFALAALMQLLRSPAVMWAIVLAALVYVAYLGLQYAKKAKGKKKASEERFCARCGHAAHSVECPICGCRR
jgi:hypothetical protein